MLNNLVFAGLLVAITIAAIANMIAVKAPRTKQIPKELIDAGADYGIKPRIVQLYLCVNHNHVLY